ncbi:MAG: hypothetical protein JO042_13260 [Sinobacteraceae bacterium]|nr:hypothetical protein [Nevskiaceae bacterium]
MLEAAILGAQRTVGFFVNATGHAAGGFLFLGLDAEPASRRGSGQPVDHAAAGRSSEPWHDSAAAG